MPRILKLQGKEEEEEKKEKKRKKKVLTKVSFNRTRLLVTEFQPDSEYSARRLREEPGGAYIVRYFKSIVAWLPAIDVGAGLRLPIHPHAVLFLRPQVTREDLHSAFPQVLAGISRLEASSTISSKADSRDSESLGSDNEADFSSSSETDSSCISALNTLFKAKYPENAAGDNYRGLPVLHAEAALMSAARSMRVDLPAGLSENNHFRTAFMVSGIDFVANIDFSLFLREKKR